MEIIRLLVVWGALIVSAPLVMAAVGMPERWAALVGVGMIFGAISHISQSPYWQYLKHKELNPFSKRFGESSAPKPESEIRHSRRLDTPAKRVWFLVFLFGVAVCAATFLIYLANDNYKGFVDALLSSSDRYDGYRVFTAFGLLIAAAGYVCAFRYEATVGRLIGWIEHG